MAMGPEKHKKTTFQHEIVCLDDLVPVEDRYRRLDELVDWSFIRAAAEPPEGPETDPTPPRAGAPAAPLSRAPPPATKAPPRGRRSSNATAVSRTDPDARLRHKPGQRPHLQHRGQVAVDPKHRCVVA